MNAITILYVLLLIAGLAWLAWKIKLHLEKEKNRESELDEQMLFDDSFKSYVEDLKKRKQRDGSGDIESGTDK
jgi:hypothetical protein